MPAVNLSAAADQGLTHWDFGLSKTIACVIRARSSLYDDGTLCDLLHALRELRRYITRSASRREASSTLESALTTVLSPLLQEFFPQEHSYDILEELLEIVGAHTPLLPFLLVRSGSRSLAKDCEAILFLTAVVLGQGVDLIIDMMGEQGIFHILTTILMYTPTTEVAAACLGRLAGTSDLAARDAQVPTQYASQ